MLAWIRAERFRNLAPERIEIDAPLVVVRGANAQGKSSLLEALYVLATTRSFRTREVREAIAFDEPDLTVTGELRGSDGSASRMGLTLGRGRGNRRLCVGEYEAKLVDYLALLPALVMAGESVRSTAGSPAERRRFMDRATAAAQPAHLRDLAEYRRVLSQRNRLLKQGRAGDRELDPWDELLARRGDAVISRRATQLEEWQKELGSWPQLFPEGDAARLTYRPSGRQQERSLLDRVRSAREADRRLAATTVGPHRDDLEIDVGGKSLWRFGSSGQVRAAIAALTLAQARTVAASRSGYQPLLIFDDIDTDLDATRFAALLEAARQEGQVIAATSKMQTGSLRCARHLRICAGRAVEDGGRAVQADGPDTGGREA